MRCALFSVAGWLGVMLAAVLGAVMVPACVAVPDYGCKTNDTCVGKDGAQGLCEASGFCGFPDSACSGSGRRYGADGSGPSTGACVPVGKTCIQALALGEEHSCALRDDGSVWCWGGNARGELGDGTTTVRPSPTKVLGLPGPATAISAGDQLTCALLKDATVWCWGLNSVLQLGQCGASPPASSAKPLAAFAYTLEKGKLVCAAAPFKAKSVSVGGKHVCALGADDGVYCWGENSVGQCGQDPANLAFEDIPGPLLVDSAPGGITDVQAGDEFSCALKDDGTAYCWGSNKLGSLGTGTGTPDTFKPVEVPSLLSVAELAIDDETACARDADGSLWCWGNGSSGLFGGNLQHRFAPERVTTVARVFAGDVAKHLCATSAVGELRCWGANLKGQAGVGNLAPNILTPTFTKLITVADVALGEEHTCATTKDGALWCWGDNNFGELGLGTLSDVPVSSPTRVAFPCTP